MLTNYNTENQLIKGILTHGPDLLKDCMCSDDISKYFDRLFLEKLEYPIPLNSANEINWFIPEEYQNLDIEKFVINQCPVENLQRVKEELELYRKNNMIIILHVMKYLVDNLRNNNILWGVGRGSSVASYVLYLIGVHKVDSVKYNLPIEEFFKGE
jgi:DNA polymerase III alpha subunit